MEEINTTLDLINADEIEKEPAKVQTESSSPDDEDFIYDINREQALFQINIIKIWKEFRIYHKRCRFNQGCNANIWRWALI